MDSSFGCSIFLRNLQAQLLERQPYILEFLTKSIPIPNIFIIIQYKLTQLTLRHNQLLIFGLSHEKIVLIKIKIIPMISQSEEENKKTIKALLCQLSPFHKDKQKNVERMSISLEKYSKDDHIDIVCFPELAFVGFNFENQKDAEPYAVEQGQGVEFAFAKKIAERLRCYVSFGYIEKEINKQGQNHLYSSAVVLNKDGTIVANHRKCHLYYNDKFWAQPGEKFTTFELINQQKKTFKCILALGTDINQKDFNSGQFELADHIVKDGSELLVLPMNWLDSQNSELHRNDISGTYNYWLNRMTPVTLSKKILLILAANRVGMEHDLFAKKETRFYGSSVAIMLNPHKILSNLEVKTEGFLLVDTFL